MKNKCLILLLLLFASKFLLCQNLKIFELRDYKVNSGFNNEFEQLFKQEFLNTQNELGAFVLGYFNNKNDSSRFVWLRGFENMKVRKESLTNFYFGNTWNKFGGRAISMLNVNENRKFLFRSIDSLSSSLKTMDDFIENTFGYDLGIFVFKINSENMLMLLKSIEEGFSKHLKDNIKILGVLIGETSENTFPILPITQDGKMLSVIYTIPKNNISNSNLILELKNYFNSIQYLITTIYHFELNKLE